MIFEIGEQLFGYRTKHVSETINIDKVFEVPLSGEATKGLINFRNNVIGIIDMGVMLWGKPVESDVVVIVQKDDTQVGMLVDDVKGVVNVEGKDLQDIEDISLDDINDEYLDAYFDYNDELVLMVNIDSVISHKDTSRSKTKLSKTVESERKDDKGILNQKGYILFQISKEWYAIEVKSINEIITYPEHLAALPMSEHSIKGAFKLRENSVILADLPELLSIDESMDRQRVILVNHNDKLGGLSIDNVRELKWISEDDLLAISREDSIQKGMLTLDNGERMALLLDVEKIISTMSNAIETNDEHKLNHNQESSVKNDNHKTYIQFSVGSVDMALPVKSVNEVVEVSGIKSLPKAAEYLVGMMNLRNSTLVIISLAKRLGITAEKSEEEQRLVVLDGQPIGLVVDELKGILYIDEMHISEPDQSIDLEENFIDGIIRKENGDMVFVLNNDVVTKHTDVDKLINKKTTTRKRKAAPKTTRRGRPPKKKVEAEQKAVDENKSADEA